jgi:hypothetical protein
LKEQFSEWPSERKGKTSGNRKRHMRVLLLAVLLSATSGHYQGEQNQGEQNSHHKGGHYKNPKASDRYGKHKP